MDYLYHYCSNSKAFSILQDKTIRMSDISKSNDSLELQLFFPTLHRKIFKLYTDNPFPFKYGRKRGINAFRELVQFSEYSWQQRFDSGDFSNFVVCFSETKDSLSQWRGYADDGKGCSIGFSKASLQSFCESTKGVLRMEKVIYITEDELNDKISYYANGIVNSLKGFREWIVSNMTKDDNDPDTDGLLAYNFDGMIEGAFIDSLRFKTAHFREEQEWRIFLSRRAYKNADWVFNKKEVFMGPALFDETLDFLNNRIDFRPTTDDLIPFCPLSFNEFYDNPVVEVWIGPKNYSRKGDIELFLRKYNYKNVNVIYSDITYR